MAEKKYEAMSRARAQLKSLFEAAKRGDIKALDKQLPREKRGEILAGYRDGHRRHALHFGAASGSVETVSWLADASPGLVDLPDENGVTPLSLAASQGHPRVCVALLDLGALSCSEDANGATPLHRAASFEGASCVETIKVLCDGGASVSANAASSGTPLHWAAGKETYSEPAVSALISHGASVDAADGRGLTAIILAAATGNGDSVAALADAGADVGFVVSGGATIAHICAQHGDLAALKAIAARGEQGRAALFAIDAEGHSPLDLAQGREDCVAFLAERGVPRRTSPVEVQEEAREQAAPSAKVENEKVLVCLDAEGALRHKDLGNEALKRCDFAKAVEEYTKAIELDATNKVFYSNRSAAKLSLLAEKVDESSAKKKEAAREALRDAEMCAELDASWPKAHFRKATAYEALEEYEEAAGSYWDALRLDPKNAMLKAALKKCVDTGRKKTNEAKSAGGGAGDESRIK